MDEQRRVRVDEVLIAFGETSDPQHVQALEVIEKAGYDGRRYAKAPAYLLCRAAGVGRDVDQDGATGDLVGACSGDHVM
jgi:hypothetical protein